MDFALGLADPLVVLAFSLNIEARLSFSVIAVAM
jgi:hypothetical protein